jgi:hypothetical protein
MEPEKNAPRLGVSDAEKNTPPDLIFTMPITMLMNGDAAGAEQTFRADLEHNPRNPRSLFGLQQSLKAQHREYDASFVEKEFNSAWKGGRNSLTMEDLV